MWSNGVLSARPTRLGQATCPIGAAPGTCGDGFDRPAAAKYADLLANKISQNPECFQGEDLSIAYALESKLRKFSISLPGGFFGGGGNTILLSEEEGRTLQEALNCRVMPIGPVTQPAPRETIPSDKVQYAGSNPIPRLQPFGDDSGIVQPLQAAPVPLQVASDKQSILPIAIGAAAALALIYAVVS